MPRKTLIVLHNTATKRRKRITQRRKRITKRRKRGNASGSCRTTSSSRPRPAAAIRPQPEA
eukprot:16444305-Heterocapsa_arctica.AAC.1